MRQEKINTVLYADYSKRNISAARTALMPLGLADFIACDDRDEALRLIDTLRPDLVLIGIYLDGMRGISTIRAVRESASIADRYCAEVPILLGAPKLDRRAMRDAVDAGIEGIFKHPIDPERLPRVIRAVGRNPRRFVLSGKYFGPARDQDRPDENTSPRNSGKSPPPSSPPSHRNTALSHPAPTGKAATIPSNPAITATTPTTTTALTDTTSDASSPSAPSPVVPSPQMAQNSKQGSKQSGKRSDNTQPKTARPARDAVMEAVAATVTETGTDNIVPGAASSPPCAAGEQVIAEELVEIDLQNALLSHRLWVDTGGKEGMAMSIDHADLRAADLEKADLSRCGLPGASFRRANCTKAVFRRCNLTAADFIDCNLDQANLAATRLSGARFKGARLHNTVFLGADLSHADFRGMVLLNCDLSGSNLTGTDFRDADLSSVRGLFAEQLQRARVNANTRLPRDLKLHG